MANYINEEILCEAYTHLKIDIFDDKEALDALKKQLLPYFEERAKFLMGKDVKINIEFEEGSLKTKLQVIGSAGLILLRTVSPVVTNPAVTIPAAMIMTYGDFRQGIDQLANDAAALAQSANLEVIFRTKTPYCDRVTIERRKGVFGRVSDLLTQIDSIRSTALEEDLPTDKVGLRHAMRTVENLILWNHRTQKLFDKIDSTLTEECVAGGLLDSLKFLPKNFSWFKKITNNDFKTKLLKSDPKFYGELEAINAQYTATLKSIKQNLESRKKAASEANKK